MSFCVLMKKKGSVFTILFKARLYLVLRPAWLCKGSALSKGNPLLLGQWPDPTDAAQRLCITLKSALIPNRLGLVLRRY